MNSYLYAGIQIRGSLAIVQNRSLRDGKTRPAGADRHRQSGAGVKAQERRRRVIPADSPCLPECRHTYILAPMEPALTLVCLRCGHSWLRRSLAKIPGTCPQCCSPLLESPAKRRRSAEGKTTGGPQDAWSARVHTGPRAAGGRRCDSCLGRVPEETRLPDHSKRPELRL